MEMMGGRTEQEQSPRQRFEKLGRSALGAVFGNKERNRERVVADAGVAMLNKGDLIGNPERLNEDAAYVDAENGVFGVFDGAGGEAGGALASNLALRSMRQAVAERPPESTDDLARMMYTANSVICNNPQAGYSTGVIGRILGHGRQKKMIYASVGDSRIYLVRHDKATQLTRDEGQGNVIDNSFGDRGMRLKQLYEVALQKGDRVVLCSDGITGDFAKDFIPDDEIGYLVGRAENAEVAANNLVRRATKIDDRTAVVVEV